MRLRPRYVRDRLTWSYVVLTGVVLAAYIGGASLLQFWQLTTQLYHAEIQDVETVEGLLYFAPDGRLHLHEDYHNHPQSRLLLDRLMEVLTPDGQILFRNTKLDGRELGGKPFAGEGRTGYYERALRLQDGTRVLVISHLHAIDGRPLLIRLAYSTQPLTHRLAEFIGLLVLALPVALLVSGVAGYRVAGKVLSPLQQMVRQTEQITANRLHDRIPVENPDDELGHMARVFNGLLQRLEESFAQLKRFTSDVSHEIRTPLASMRSVGEVGLQKACGPEEYRDVIGSMLEEVSRLTQMVDTLLTISRADAGQIAVRKAVFPLMDLLREVITVVGVLAEEKKQILVVSGSETAAVNADRSILRQAIINLLDNAVKYSPPGSPIRLTLQFLPDSIADSATVKLGIEDEGPGIPAESRSKVFDRFYRVEEARSREAGGTGLGLAIAKWAVAANGGTIEVQPSATGGCLFSLTLPAATTAGRGSSA